LAEAGIDVLVLDADHVQLQTPAGPMTMRLQHRPRPLFPSQLPPDPSSTTLLHVPKISTKTLRRAETSGWSVITDDGHLSLLLKDGTRFRRQPTRPEAPARKRSPGPPQYGRFAVVRRLLEEGPHKQARLAADAGMTQSRISRILGSLREQGLLTRTHQGWAPADWDKLCDWFLTSYPGPGGMRMHWYSLDSTPGAAEAAGTAALAANTRLGLSGDVAADLVLPWRRPRSAVVYADRGFDLTQAGMTPAVSPRDATLTVIVPKDPGVWPPRPWTPRRNVSRMEVVDPVQVLYDLYTATGPDAEQAADQWRFALRAGILPDFPNASSGTPEA
jgi:hypothetical protein